MTTLKTTRTTLVAAAFIVAGVMGLVLTQPVDRLGATSAAWLSLIVPPAHAVVGRPLTPVSYAGVARRTSRRVSRRHAVYY
jgi:hypothetical protein